MLRPGAARKLPLGRVGAAKTLILLARPERFERPTPRFVVCTGAAAEGPRFKASSSPPQRSERQQAARLELRQNPPRTDIGVGSNGDVSVNGLHCVRGLTIVSTRSLYVLEGEDLPATNRG
jgi:hypothetical protein